MKIKMVRHYCGFLNNNADFWPDEEKAVPDDVSEDAADQLIERGYAVKVGETRAAVAVAKVTKKSDK